MVQADQAVPSVQGGFIPFSYEGIMLRESCWHEGKPCCTSRAIGEWLDVKHPDRYVRKILERNPHIKQFATLVNLTSVEGGRKVTREVEVFDPIGLQLIIFESHQPKAKQYKIAVAHLVYDYVTGNLKPFKWSGDVASALSQIISLPASGGKRKLLVLDLAKELGKSYTTIYRMAAKMNGENLKTCGGKSRKTRKNKASFIHLPEFQQVADYEKDHPGAGGREIKIATGISFSESTINRWVRYIRSHTANLNNTRQLNKEKKYG